MRVWVLTALVLAPVVGAVLGPSATAADTFCAQTFGEVPVGIGEPVPLPVPLLAGVAYVDVPFHSCSGGGYSLEAESDTVQATRLCTQEVVRVWSVAGEAGKDFVITWYPHGKDDCP